MNTEDGDQEGKVPHPVRLSGVMPSREKSSKLDFDPKMFLERGGRGVTLERYQKNQRIFAQGDAADTIGFLRKGSVKATILSGHGKEAIVGIFCQGQFFGESGVGSSKLRSATVVALEESLVSLITRETMLSLLASEPAFSRFFLDQCCRGIAALKVTWLISCFTPANSGLRDCCCSSQMPARTDAGRSRCGLVKKRWRR
jgi:hypothetical protein